MKLPHVSSRTVLTFVLGGSIGVAVGALSVKNARPATITAASTAALALVTLGYVVLVNRQVAELRSQRTGEAERWDRERALQNLVRIRERSEDAAWRSLEALNDSGVRPGEGTLESVTQAARSLFHALERNAPFIVDLELSDRMKTAGVLFWMMAWGPDALAHDNVNAALLSIRARWIADRCSAALQCHLNDQPLPDWADFPRYVDAQAWVWRECAVEAGHAPPQPLA